jgi:hypothetical protein
MAVYGTDNLQLVPETSKDLEILKHAITINQIIGRFTASGISLDHGTLVGLSDDDHTQYYNAARLATVLADYYTIVAANAAFAPIAHTHSTADITNLASYTGFDARYYTESEVDTALAGKSNTGHTHASSDVTDFAEAVDDRVNALLVAGTNVTLTYNDGSNTLTIDATGAGGASTLDDLTDAVVSGMEYGATLTYNGTSWQQLTGLLATEILADTPKGYWKFNETSGTSIADSSGNGYNLTIAGTYTLAFTYLVPGDLDKFVYFAAGANGASRSGASGMTMPSSGDYTLAWVVLPLDFSTNPVRGPSILGTGETEATNYQFQFSISTTGELQVFYEYAAGTNATVLSGINIVEGRAYILHAAKDGTANTITFYINGRKVAVVAYTNEPSGGSSVSTAVGYDGTASTGAAVVGHVAIFDSKLTDERIWKHAQAAGLAQ